MTWGAQISALVRNHEPVAVSYLLNQARGDQQSQEMRHFDRLKVPGTAAKNSSLGQDTLSPSLARHLQVLHAEAEKLHPRMSLNQYIATVFRSVHETIASFWQKLSDRTLAKSKQPVAFDTDSEFSGRQREPLRAWA